MSEEIASVSGTTKLSLTDQVAYADIKPKPMGFSIIGADSRTLMHITSEGKMTMDVEDAPEAAEVFIKQCENLLVTSVFGDIKNYIRRVKELHSTQGTAIMSHVLFFEQLAEKGGDTIEGFEISADTAKVLAAIMTKISDSFMQGVAACQVFEPKI